MRSPSDTSYRREARTNWDVVLHIYRHLLAVDGLLRLSLHALDNLRGSLAFELEQ